MIYIVLAGGGLFGVLSQESFLMSLAMGIGVSSVLGVLSFLFYFGVHSSTFVKTLKKVVSGGIYG